VVKKIKAGSIIAIVFICILIVSRIMRNNVGSIEDFQAIMKTYGVWGPLVLTAIQALQVVVPILPGDLGCAVGAISYGAVVGFVCNYVGICLGSIIAFYLAHHYGKSIVIDMFSERTYEKWKAKAENKKSYDLFLFVATLLPLFPDDFLCYFSGLIRMNERRFIWIILLGKPWCILMYSILFGFVK